VGDGSVRREIVVMVVRVRVGVIVVAVATKVREVVMVAMDMVRMGAVVRLCR